jgi:hypothetical protein
MTVKELEKAVADLTPEEFAAFRDWLAAYDQDRWDDQIERDMESGKLDKLLEEAKQDQER